MGGSSYSSDTFTRRVAATKAAGRDYFAHSADIDSGAAPAGTHPDLIPSKPNKAGVVTRESRDSEAHPASTAVAVLMDVTGSQRAVPRVFVDKLNTLMAVLTKRGYISDPQILFGAIGDAYSDDAPLQLGQYESGNEMTDVLAKLYLEGNGGSQKTESYELAMYFMARHSALDCLEKRGKKGYMFISGDELPKPFVNPKQVKALIGDDIAERIPLKAILAELREKYEVYWLLPANTTYFDDPEVNEGLKDLFGQNLIKLKKPDEISEVIAAVIGANEGFDLNDIESDLVAAGSTKAAARNATTAIAAYVAASPKLAKRASVEGDLAPAPVKRPKLQRL